MQMTNNDFQQWVNRLEGVSDNDLRNELKNINFCIDEKKFSIAASCYGATVVLYSLPPDEFRKYYRLPVEAPNSVAVSTQYQACFVLRAYAALVYMRSNDLERGLNEVYDQSPIRPFRDFFRAGSKKENRDSIAQHLRNSLSHGTFNFEITDKFYNIFFKDRDWEAKLDAFLFYNGICSQVKRFYWCAYEVKHKISS